MLERRVVVIVAINVTASYEFIFEQEAMAKKTNSFTKPTISTAGVIWSSWQQGAGNNSNKWTKVGNNVPMSARFVVENILVSALNQLSVSTVEKLETLRKTISCQLRIRDRSKTSPKTTFPKATKAREGYT